MQNNSHTQSVTRIQSQINRIKVCILCQNFMLTQRHEFWLVTLSTLCAQQPTNETNKLFQKKQLFFALTIIEKIRFNVLQSLRMT